MIFVTFMSLIALILDVSKRELKDLLILERSIYVLFAYAYIEGRSLFNNFNYCQTCSYN